MHCDIKPHNFVLFGLRWKVIDLESARQAGEPVSMKVRLLLSCSPLALPLPPSTPPLPLIPTTAPHTHHCPPPTTAPHPALPPSTKVSPSYCSPELARAVLGKQADRMRAACTLDMWSFGLVFFELFARQPYFADKPDTMQQLASYAELEVPKDIVDDIQARHVLKKLLVKNHVERANIQAVLKHAYLCGGMDTIQKASSFGYLQQTQEQLQTMLTDLSSHVKAG